MLRREQILGIARHLLNTFGAVFVSKGVIDGDQLTAGISAILVIASIAWSIAAPEKKGAIGQ